MHHVAQTVCSNVMNTCTRASCTTDSSIMNFFSVLLLEYLKKMKAAPVLGRHHQ